MLPFAAAAAAAAKKIHSSVLSFSIHFVCWVLNTLLSTSFELLMKRTIEINYIALLRMRNGRCLPHCVAVPLGSSKMEVSNADDYFRFAHDFSLSSNVVGSNVNVRRFWYVKFIESTWVEAIIFIWMPCVVDYIRWNLISVCCTRNGTRTNMLSDLRVTDQCSTIYPLQRVAHGFSGIAAKFNQLYWLLIIGK